ncbi:LysR family transcriptional regulator [Falsirhodobacter halotolerans]|uniref:LysR family transcriptional regulator n=1 Tax=Falsirhodobacter halotolerans TaxID=1146892 RepID=UPI001FD2EB8F|nr:LysR family transcriptional regulator [Falsirhodobacter halotolerans]MCJ8140092.1 LysR family transcriptional regulator [Falsirhodobacter halotolerans]
MNDAGPDPEISLRLLEIFAAMMRSSTTIEAADILHISQPAVSAGLRQLEANLGLVLFERRARRLEPTNDAHTLYEEIRPLFGLMRGVARRTREMRMGMIGRLRVLSTHPLGNSVVPLALSRFLNARPDISISYDVRNLAHVIEAVQGGTADLGLAVLNTGLEQVNVEPLMQSRMVALVPADDLLAAHDVITAEDLRDKTLLGIEQDSQLGGMIRDGFRQQGVPYYPRVESRLCQTAALLSAHGLGCAIVDPWSAGVFPLPGMVVRPWHPEQTVWAVILTRKGVPHSELLKRFVSEVQDVLKGDTGDNHTFRT